MKILIYILFTFLIIISPFLGEINIPFNQIFSLNDSLSMVFWDLRVPRVILAFFVGSILALSGLIFQIVFKNELITPYTLGIASVTTLFSDIYKSDEHFCHSHQFWKTWGRSHRNSPDKRTEFLHPFRGPDCQTDCMESLKSPDPDLYISCTVPPNLQIEV